MENRADKENGSDPEVGSHANYVEFTSALTLMPEYAHRETKLSNKEGLARPDVGTGKSP